MKIKWYSESLFFDTETAEVLDRSEIEKGNYIKIKYHINIKNVENDESKKIRQFQWECERNRQTRLF